MGLDKFGFGLFEDDVSVTPEYIKEDIYGPNKQIEKSDTDDGPNVLHSAKWCTTKSLTPSWKTSSHGPPRISRQADQMGESY